MPSAPVLTAGENAAKVRTLGQVELLIAFAIPLVEEFSFRGHVQRLLERRYGVPVAIVMSAILFMSLHIGVPHWSILGISLTLGLAAGLAVWWGARALGALRGRRVG